MELTPNAIPFEAPSHVLAALAEVGRTEDISLSPSNGRLVLAGFDRNSLLVIDIDRAERETSGRLRLTGCTEVFSPELHAPHGISFLHEDRIAVANREGAALIFELPPVGYEAAKVLMVPTKTLRGGWRARIATPGSLAAVPVGPSQWDILVCNNYRDTVTCHRVEGANLRVRSNRVLLSAGLSIPDGVAVSQDGRWIAVSNHNTQSVYLYENDGGLNRRSTPEGTLLEVEYPHGLRFSADGQWIFVASAASPYIFVYESGRDSWQGARRPVGSIQVMDDETFIKGRYNPEEGGPKGLDVSQELDLLVTTSEHQTLAFFELSALLEARTRTPSAAH